MRLVCIVQPRWYRIVDSTNSGAAFVPPVSRQLDYEGAFGLAHDHPKIDIIRIVVKACPQARSSVG